MPTFPLSFLCVLSLFLSSCLSPALTKICRRRTCRTTRASYHFSPSFHHTHTLSLSYAFVIRAIVASSCHLDLPSNSLGRATLQCHTTPRPPLSRFPESSHIWDINGANVNITVLLCVCGSGSLPPDIACSTDPIPTTVEDSKKEGDLLSRRSLSLLKWPVS
jgi:hypothetical protein